MTLEQLEQFRGMRAEVVAIQKEIETLYSPISSPNGHTEGGHGTTPGNPTEQAAMRVIDRKKALESKVYAMQEALAAIDEWLDTVDDSKLRAIIRWHYINGLTWKQTNVKVYGYANPHRAQKKVLRFFKNVPVSNLSNA